MRKCSQNPGDLQVSMLTESLDVLYYFSFSLYYLKIIQGACLCLKQELGEWWTQWKTVFTWGSRVVTDMNFAQVHVDLCGMWEYASYDCIAIRLQNVLILSALKRHKLSKWPSAELKLAAISDIWFPSPTEERSEHSGANEFKNNDQN